MGSRRRAHPPHGPPRPARLSPSLLTQVAPRVKDVRTSSIACGVGNVLGNKGAVGVSLSVDALRLLFINSHLAAHDEHIERRNADYQRIFTGLFSASATTGNVAVPATPGTAASSGASTPRQAESPQRGSSPRLDELAGLSQQQLAANPSLARMSRLAHVSSMSQLPQPAAFNATSFASQPSSARDPPPSPPPAAAGAGGAVEGGGSLSTSSVPPGGVGVAPPAALVPPPLVVGPQQSALPLHDVVFWSGDLNYRINGADAAIRQLLTSDMIEVCVWGGGSRFVFLLRAAGHTIDALRGAQRRAAGAPRQRPAPAADAQGQGVPGEARAAAFRGTGQRGFSGAGTAQRAHTRSPCRAFTSKRYTSRPPSSTSRVPTSTAPSASRRGATACCTRRTPRSRRASSSPPTTSKWMDAVDGWMHGCLAHGVRTGRGGASKACSRDVRLRRAVPSLMDSDHRAVVAGFDVVFTPGLLTLPAGTSGPGSGCLVA